MTFFFDNTFSTRVVEVLKCLGVTAIHLQERFSADTADIDWIPKVAEAGWIVVTGDGRMRKNPVERKALEEAGLVIVIVWKEYLNKDKWHQTWWITKHWQEIQKRASKARPRTSLYVKSSGKIERL